MNTKSLLRIVKEKNIKKLAIIGLAKNTGKTATLNSLISEAEAEDIIIAAASYGRDGEEIDVITRQKKPRIIIPSGAIFVTAEEVYERSGVEGELLFSPGMQTPLGDINIYRNCGQKNEIELVGLNKRSRLKRVIEKIESDTDLILIDGALDRRSSSVPGLVDAAVMATGAVLGNTGETVVDKTLAEVEKFTTPALSETCVLERINKLQEKDRSALMEKNGSIITFDKPTSIGLMKEIKKHSGLSPLLLFLKGALTDRLVEGLVGELNWENMSIVVKDATRIFLKPGNLRLLAEREIDLKVLEKSDLVAITVNPTSPYGVNFSSERLVEDLQKKIKEIPVFDIRSQDYAGRN